MIIKRSFWIDQIRINAQDTEFFFIGKFQIIIKRDVTIGEIKTRLAERTKRVKNIEMDIKNMRS